jgi:2-succinyl-6-hydroxy-2,4-cyclohexadiene-1-carboxylate synthase
MNSKVYCLHGFLGLPSDWNFLGNPPEASLEKVDLFRILSPSTGASMMDWAESFNHQVAQKSEKRVLLGYSMGGRLALHSLIRNPSLWAGAVIVSANPAPLPEEREPRLVADEAWARRFENENWDSAVSAWENHPVFGGKPIPFVRRREDFRREDLAGAFRAWSLARQENLTPRLSDLEFPILWITGEQDSRYHEIARRVQSQASPADIEFVSIPDSCHRVPWEQTEAFQSHFSSFLQRIFC